MKALIPSSQLRSSFLAYWLLSQEQHILTTCVKKGATVQSIAMETLRSQELPLPPSPEQDRIVEILDQADTLRQQRRQADALSQRILPALFHEMFGDPNRNEREWPTLPLDEAFDDVSRQGNKIPRSEYLASGKIPVVDQGQDEIAGYWDEVGDAYRGQLPVILFGDHTRIFKLLEHPFCIGADGVRLLRPKAMDCHFAFGLLTLLDVPSRGYSRHFKELRSLSYIYPPPDLQERFGKALAELRKLSAKATNQTTSSATLETLFQTLLHRAFDGSLTAKWREGRAKEVLQEMENKAR
jgi:type I restriction enzyme S subunit